MTSHCCHSLSLFKSDSNALLRQILWVCLLIFATMERVPPSVDVILIQAFSHSVCFQPHCWPLPSEICDASKFSNFIGFYSKISLFTTGFFLCKHLSFPLFLSYCQLLHIYTLFIFQILLTFLLCCCLFIQSLLLLRTIQPLFFFHYHFSRILKENTDKKLVFSAPYLMWSCHNISKIECTVWNTIIISVPCLDS